MHTPNQEVATQPRPIRSLEMKSENCTLRKEYVRKPDASGPQSCRKGSNCDWFSPVCRLSAAVSEEIKSHKRRTQNSQKHQFSVCTQNSEAVF